MGSKSEKTLGGFQVKDEIGEGGMGVVLLAHQTGLDRPVVLKHLRKECSGNKELRQRFEREAKAASAIHHQNVVAVYDTFVHRDNLYIAQEYVDGVDLRGVLSGALRIPPYIATCIILELLRGLEEIHYRGMVHRDLKPANVLLSREGDVKIADFGIALDPSASPLTLPGVVLGSPPYMAPEQILGETVGPRSDLFALGVLFYEMLSGIPPYRESEGRDQETFVGRVFQERYDPIRDRAPEVPRRLVRIVRTCLKPRRKNRYPSASVLREILERRYAATSPLECRTAIAEWLQNSGILEAPENATVVAPETRPHRQHGRLIGAAAAAVVLLLTLACGTLWLTGTNVRPYLDFLPFVGAEVDE